MILHLILVQCCNTYTDVAVVNWRRAKVIITASGGARGTKVVPLKSIVDSAVDITRKAGFQVARLPECSLLHHAACALQVSTVSLERFVFCMRHCHASHWFLKADGRTCLSGHLSAEAVLVQEQLAALPSAINADDAGGKMSKSTAGVRAFAGEDGAGLGAPIGAQEEVPLGGRQGRVVSGRGTWPARRVPCCDGGLRAPAVPAVHLGVHRQAQGRRALHRRAPRLSGPQALACVCAVRCRSCDTWSTCAHNMVCLTKEYQHHCWDASRVIRDVR